MTVCRFLALFALLALTTGTHALAGDAPPTMLIIDGSGSMWGPMDPDRRAKFDVVRDLVAAQLDIPGDRPVGLVSFGHRRRSDCSDVEVISAPTTDRATLKDALARLNPRGKGPLAAAIRAAARSFEASQPANLIVIHDGVDNCRQDSCAAAAELAQTHPKIAVHMISIGIDSNAEPRLACLAKTTGGTFHNVLDVASLSAAIDEVAKIALHAPDGAMSSRSTPGGTDITAPSPSATGIQATASLAAGGPSINIPVHWRILRGKTDAVVAERDGTALKIELEPGVYAVEASSGSIAAKQEVEVASGHMSGIIVPLDAARLTVLSQGEQAAATSATVVVTVDPAPDVVGQQPILSRKLGASEILRPGAYTVAVADGSVRRSKPLTLKAGDDATLEFALGAGRIELSAGLREDGGAIEDVTFSLSEDDPDSPDGRREIARSRAPAPAFTVPAGTYYASARSGEGEVHARIAVSAGDVVKRALIMPLVAARVSVTIGAEPATGQDGIAVRVTALDGNRGEIVRSVRPELALSLLPGRYRIAAHLDAYHLKVAKEVTIEAGKSVDIALNLEAGEVALKPGRGALAGRGDNFWEISDAEGKVVWRTLSGETRAFLAPGHYTVRLDYRDRSTTAAFDIQAGERKVIELDLDAPP